MKAMKIGVWLLLVLWGLSFQALAGERFHEKSGGFSYEVPKDWTVREFPGLKYNIVYTTPEHDFAPNINFIDEAYSGSLDTYYQASMKSLDKAIDGFKVLAEGKGKTGQGKAYQWLRFTQQSKSGELTQITYFMDMGKGKKLVITCTTLSERYASLDKVFNGFIKTVRID